MTTAFAATLVYGPEALCPGSKMSVYKLQMPSSATSGGDTCDVSGSIRYVRTFSADVNDTVTELAYKYSLVGGTYSSTYCGYPGATVKVVAHQSAGSAAAFDEANGVDLSGADSLLATFIGY